ncbi:hypothetical protein ABIE67_008236 [Streptomyces sp. V4I8]
MLEELQRLPAEDVVADPVPLGEGALPEPAVPRVSRDPSRERSAAQVWVTLMREMRTSPWLSSAHGSELSQLACV